jgi:site-specific recombinase XerD
MNRRPPSFLPLSKAAAGFLQYKTAEGLSPNTLKRYQQFLRLWLEFAGDVPINRIKTDDVRRFLIWLRTDYQPKRMTGGDQPLASKTIHSTYMCLSAFYTWANREFELPNPIKAIPAPKFEMAQIDPPRHRQTRSGRHSDFAGYRVARFGTLGLTSWRC